MKLTLTTAIVMTMAAPATARPIIVVIDQPQTCSGRLYEAEMAKAQKVVNDTIGAERKRAKAEHRKPREVRVAYKSERPQTGTYGGDVRTQPGAPIRTSGC